MSEPIKFKTFRDLRSLPKDKAENATGSTSRASLSDITANPAKPQENNDLKARQIKSNEVSPTRDFQKVPNSVTRLALPNGMFRGKSKQVWDYFWSISRGAINPTRTFKKSRQEIKDGSGLGSMVTVDAAIKHLQQLGLIKVNQIIGSGGGNEYEVFSPDEINLSSTTSTSRASNTSSDQKLPLLDIQKLDILALLDSSRASITQVVENKEKYLALKTSLKTLDKTDDEPAALGALETVLDKFSKKISGKGIKPADAGKLKELTELLEMELEIAAAHTTSISNIPAFFTEHLRRRLLKRTGGASDGGTGEKKVFGKSPQRNKKIKIADTSESDARNYEAELLTEDGRRTVLETMRQFIEKGQQEYVMSFQDSYAPEDWQWLTENLARQT